MFQSKHQQPSPSEPRPQSYFPRFTAMTKATPELHRTTSTGTTPSKAYYFKPQQKRSLSKTSLFSPKLSIYLLASCVILFIILHIRSLETPPSDKLSPSSSSQSWASMHQQWQRVINATGLTFNYNCSQDLKSMAAKLRHAVTFLPLKDLRYADTALQGHTWFMSSLYDSHVDGEVQYQQFPSESSKGRLLCLMGHDTHNGARNSYALAWPETLPYNATLMKGLTFISYNHYNYDNIWHGLSAMVPFVAWQMKNGCAKPNRWILYHWGELRFHMGTWLKTLMEATFGGPINIEKFEKIGDNEPICFEETVVMRHNEGGMSRERRMEVYDLMRCKARVYCDVSRDREASRVADRTGGLPEIGMTLFMRTGPRSFKNESVIVAIFEKECAKVHGCRLTVAHSNNLTICEQVKLMSLTDILVSSHGAQLTNMFLMDRNSSVMEFFPKGWLKLAGVGQFVYHWIASWSGMRHQGAWRDPNGEICPYPEDDRRCMSIYKNGRIGYNETAFSEWARNVLNEVKVSKMEEATSNRSIGASTKGCACS